jgi:6-phosphogluconolactonase
MRLIRLGVVLAAVVWVGVALSARFADGLMTQVSDRARQASGGALMYVGTYTGKNSQGIYLFRVETTRAGGKDEITLTPAGLAAESQNPSYLDVDPTRRVLFAVNETSDFGGKPTGGVSAFSIDPASGRLTLINQQPSMGTSPCYVRLDGSRRNLLVANYGSGTVAVLPVAADGRLGEATSVVQHTGKSVNPKRQQGPHAHCITLDPSNRFAFACDLGIDKILAYRFDAVKGTLSPNEPPSVSVAPGSGPRSMAFRPDGRFAYVGNEMTSTVTAFRYDAGAGTLHEVQTLSTLPAGPVEGNSIAEVAMHPSGRYLYVSNRGHNSVVLFAIDQNKGTLTLVADQSSGGKTPRHFGIDPSGAFLVMANQHSDTLLPARIDPASGRLTPSGAPVAAPTPVFVKLLPPLDSVK